jgi:hypothetical protein
MKNQNFTRPLAALGIAAVLALGAMGDASARNLSYSVGGGVKCYYVLTSSVNNVNVYQTVCRKSGV